MGGRLWGHRHPTACGARDLDALEDTVPALGHWERLVGTKAALGPRVAQPSGSLSLFPEKLLS